MDVWSLQTGRELITFTEGQCDAADVMALSPDASYFVRAGRNGLLAFNPDGFGHRGSFRGSAPLQLWEIATENEILGPWQDIGDTCQNPYSHLFTVYSQSVRINRFKHGTLTLVLNCSALIRDGH